MRFNVAGILTRYKGQQYLLLQKATRIYSYGNFGEINFTAENAENAEKKNNGK